MNEPSLIRSAQEGDLDAFNTLVLSYQDSVYNTALRILGESEPAKDASQEAFISAFRSINSYRGGSFRGWLYAIRRAGSLPDLVIGSNSPISMIKIATTIPAATRQLLSIDLADPPLASGVL